MNKTDQSFLLPRKKACIATHVYTHSQMYSVINSWSRNVWFQFRHSCKWCRKTQHMMQAISNASPIHATYFTTEHRGQKVSLHRWHNWLQEGHTALLQWLQRPPGLSHSERHEQHALVFCLSFPLPLYPAPPPCIVCWRVSCLPGALLQQETLSLSAW